MPDAKPSAETATDDTFGAYTVDDLEREEAAAAAGSATGAAATTVESEQPPVKERVEKKPEAQEAAPDAQPAPSRDGASAPPDAGVAVRGLKREIQRLRSRLDVLRRESAAKPASEPKGITDDEREALFQESPRKYVDQQIETARQEVFARQKAAEDKEQYGNQATLALQDPIGTLSKNFRDDLVAIIREDDDPYTRYLNQMPPEFARRALLGEYAYRALTEFVSKDAQGEKPSADAPAKAKADNVIQKRALTPGGAGAGTMKLPTDEEIEEMDAEEYLAIKPALVKAGRVAASD